MRPPATCNKVFSAGGKTGPTFRWAVGALGVHFVHDSHPWRPSNNRAPLTERSQGVSRDVPRSTQTGGGWDLLAGFLQQMKVMGLRVLAKDRRRWTPLIQDWYLQDQTGVLSPRDIGAGSENPGLPFPRNAQQRLPPPSHVPLHRPIQCLDVLQTGLADCYANNAPSNAALRGGRGEREAAPTPQHTGWTSRDSGIRARWQHTGLLTLGRLASAQRTSFPYSWLSQRHAVHKTCSSPTTHQGEEG